MNKHIKEYLEHEGKRQSKDNIRSLKGKLKKLENYLSEEQLQASELTVRHAQNYQGRLLKLKTKNGSPYARNTLCRCVTEASRFYEFLKTKKIVLSNPFRDIKRLRDQKAVPKNILDAKKMDRLLCGLEKWEEEPTLKKKMYRYRLHVLSELMYSTGMRIGEAAGLTQDDVDLENGFITLNKTKTGESRICFLSEYARRVLDLYINKMRTWVFRSDNVKTGKLFGAGTMCLETGLNRLLKKVCVKLKLPVITSHGFRHSFGYQLLKAGCDLRFIQELLGHRRLYSTQIYTKVEKKDLREVLDKYHPRSIRSIKQRKESA